jgi:hypothetical protein
VLFEEQRDSCAEGEGEELEADSARYVGGLLPKQERNQDREHAQLDSSDLAAQHRIVDAHLALPSVHAISVLHRRGTDAEPG